MIAQNTGIFSLCYCLSGCDQCVIHRYELDEKLPHLTYKSDIKYKLLYYQIFECRIGNNGLILTSPSSKNYYKSIYELC